MASLPYADIVIISAKAKKKGGHMQYYHLIKNMSNFNLRLQMVNRANRLFYF